MRRARKRAQVTASCIALTMAGLLGGGALWRLGHGHAGSVASPSKALVSPTARAATPLHHGNPSLPPRAVATTARIVPPVQGAALHTTTMALTGTALTAPGSIATGQPGRLALVDQNGRRVVVLDGQGDILRPSTRNPVPAPGAIAAVAEGANYVYVLDGARGVVDRYSRTGAFMSKVFSSPLLHDAHGLALGPNATLYLVGPRADGVIVVSAATGEVERYIKLPVDADLNGPAGVAVDPRSNVYVLMNTLGRLVEFTSQDNLVHQWSATATTGARAEQIAALGDGRAVATDPSGALWVYATDAAGATTLTRHPLAGGASEPLGVAVAPLGKMLLVTDAKSGRVLTIPLSAL